MTPEFCSLNLYAEITCSHIDHLFPSQLSIDPFAVSQLAVLSRPLTIEQLVEQLHHLCNYSQLESLDFIDKQGVEEATFLCNSPGMQKILDKSVQSAGCRVQGAGYRVRGDGPKSSFHFTSTKTKKKQQHRDISMHLRSEGTPFLFLSFRWSVHLPASSAEC